MSEMKAYTRQDIFTDTTDEVRNANEFYVKSEVDETIAELRDKLRHYPVFIAMLESDKLEILNDKIKIRHQKCKRCLAMVKYCEYRFMNLEKMIDTEYRTKKMRFSHRWWVKWLKLADKFKEAK